MTMTNEEPILSDRQIEVLRAVAKGLSNQEIAKDLDISVNTVRVHLRNIFEKIEVQSRTEATMWAVQQGLVTTDAPVNGDVAIAKPTPEPSAIAPLALPILTRWQRIYFVIALLIALVFLTIPVIRPILKPGDIGPLQPQFEGRWSIRAQMPTARIGLALASHNEELYVIGGNRTSGPTGLVEILTLESLDWREGSGKPTPVTDIQAVVIDNMIYVPGGCDESGQATNVLEIFDPVTNTWTRGAMMPQSVCAYAATIHGTMLYIIGGKDGEQYTDSVLIYNADEDTWRVSESSYPVRLGYGAATTIGDSIYVAGGYDGQREYADVNVLDTNSHTWSPGPSLAQARGGLGLVSADGTLLAIGGGWTSSISTNEQLGPDKKQWEIFETPYRDTWHSFGVTADDANVYIAGGWNGDYLDLVTAYQIRFNLFLPIVQ